MADDLNPIFDSAAKEWNVDPTLLRAIAGQETGGTANPSTAVSSAGARGRMQIMPDTAQELGVTDPSDDAQSIYGGAKYLSQMLDRYKTPELALAAYNAGPGRVDDYLAGKAPLPTETLNYVPGITKRYQAIKTPAVPAQPTMAPESSQSADDPFTAALKSAAQAPANAPVDNDPFTQAVAMAKQQATPAQPTAVAEQPMSPNEYGITDDPQQFNKLSSPQLVQPAATAVSNIASEAVKGAGEGFGSAPLGLSQASKDNLAAIGVYNKPGEYNPLKTLNAGVVNGLAAGGDLALRAASALLGAYQHGISQAGTEVGAPLLGRDLAALPEAFPTGDTTGGTALPRMAAQTPVSNPLVRDISQASHDAMDAPLSPEFRDNPFRKTTSNPLNEQEGSSVFTVDPHGNVNTQGATSPNEAAQNPQAPGSGSAAPETSVGPQSVGAAATPSMTELTPAQTKAYRSTAEGQKLLEPQQAGVSDPNVYVPGVTPNAAEIEQTVKTARELKALNISAPEVSQEAKQVASDNNDARQQYFSNVAGSPVTVQSLREARSAQFDRDSANTLANVKGAPDIEPVATAVQDILNSPTGRQNTELQTYVKPLLNRLQNADGTAKITDPAELIGFRQDVNRMLSKTSQAATPNLAHISGELQSIVGITDDAIEKAAPGYAQQRANYANFSHQIDEQTALQDIEPKLFGANNQMQYSRVQNAMKQIVDARQSPGNNPYKSITDETMQKLWNLRDDLRRAASAKELAAAPGSDTAQNAFDIIKGVGKSTANLAVHGALLSNLGPAANVVYTGVKNALSAGAEARAIKKQTVRGMQILHPDPATLRNPLQSE